jgi:putative chitinase
MINRKKFFDGVRFQPFDGKLKVSQVRGMDFILDEWERRKLTDLRHLAYILATTKWETAHTMQPIVEGGGERYLKSKKYWPWYGRGYVQLTWERNYKAFRNEVKELFDLDIVADPDNALNPKVAAYIMFEGMYSGTFTGKRLGNYFNKTITDWRNARRIINGTDKMDAIAEIAKQFYADLTLAT